MSDLVIGEGVALDLQLAKLASRSLAFAIDVMLQFTALLICYLIIFAGPGGDDALLAAVVLVVTVAVLVGYPVIFETLTKGRTLGKMALGLRVVRDDGGPIRFRHALVRGLAGFFVDFWALGLGGFVGMIVSLSSKKGKRVGDYLAGTVVIRQRVPEHELDHVYLPPHLRQWASDLDLSGLPNDLALAVRQYLGRRRKLSPAASYDLGHRLAVQVSEHIGVPIPPTESSQTYLAAVMGERREREEAKVAAAHNPPARPPFAPPNHDAPWRPVERTRPPAASQPGEATKPEVNPFTPPS